MPPQRSTVAAFDANVWESQSGTEFVPGHVTVDRERIVLSYEDDDRVIPLATVFDLAVGTVPYDLDHARGGILTLGFRNEETRQLASIEADTHLIDRLTVALFELVLTGTPVIVNDPAWVDEQQHLTPPESAILSVSPEELSFNSPNSTVVFETDAISRFERVASGPNGGLPITIGVYRSTRHSTVRTDVTFDSRAAVNLFGRYLDVYTDASGEATPSLTVLIIDDEEGLAETMALLLAQERERHAFHPLEGPKEAIDYLADRPDVDCIVSDYKMGGMNGIDLLKAVREVRPNLPFILLTGKGNEGVAERALVNGVTDYMRKGPLEDQVPELATRIEKAVAETRPHVEHLA